MSTFRKILAVIIAITAIISAIVGLIQIGWISNPISQSPESTGKLQIDDKIFIENNGSQKLELTFYRPSEKGGTRFLVYSPDGEVLDKKVATAGSKKLMLNLTGEGQSHPFRPYYMLPLGKYNIEIYDSSSDNLIQTTGFEVKAPDLETVFEPDLYPSDNESKYNRIEMTIRNKNKSSVYFDEVKLKMDSPEGEKNRDNNFLLLTIPGNTQKIIEFKIQEPIEIKLREEERCIIEFTTKLPSNRVWEYDDIIEVRK